MGGSTNFGAVYRFDLSDRPATIMRASRVIMANYYKRTKTGDGIVSTYLPVYMA